MLGGFGGGYCSGLGVGGSSFARIALKLLVARRQREAVALDRFAEQLYQDRFVSIVEFRHDLSMRRNRSDGETAPLTLGQALTAQVRLIVWCKACGHRAEPDVAEQVAHHGSGMTVIDWASRLRCQDCGERSADFVISGASL